MMEARERFLEDKEFWEPPTVNEQSEANEPCTRVRVRNCGQ